MTKYNYYYIKEGRKIILGKKSRNDFIFVVTTDHWNCGSHSFHTTYESAYRRLLWNYKKYPKEQCENTKIVEVQVEEI